jgi:hypothetical protein
MTTFRYRGNLYEVPTLNKHIILPGRVLVLDRWSLTDDASRMSRLHLSDVRPIPATMTPDEVARSLDGVIATPIEMTAMLDYEVLWDLRILVHHHSRKFVVSNEAYEQGTRYLYIPDAGFFEIITYLESMPVKLLLGPPLPKEACGDLSDVIAAVSVYDAIDFDR